MFYNTTDSENTAFGAKALSGSASGPTTGSANTAIGFQALYQNAGNNNTAVGTDAMEHNTSGYDNTAVGAAALYSGGGVANTALGYGALTSDIDGRNNTASGFRTLFFNTEGNNNIATGYSALYSNVTGSNNIAIGNMAGYAITNTSDNIDIGNQGVAGDSGIIRIGASPTQTTVYIAGINTTMVTGSAVYVTSKGQLGVLASSERYKTEIVSMGSNTERLQRLRPVSFHLKTDPKRELQYGLIAEEVDKVYPELVIRDEAGKIQGVRYDELAPMLLNEMQRQQQKLDAQAEQLYNVQQQLAELKQLNQSMQAALSKLQAPDEHVAMR
jgi:hypothetical protein